MFVGVAATNENKHQLQRLRWPWHDAVRDGRKVVVMEILPVGMADASGALGGGRTRTMKTKSGLRTSGKNRSFKTGAVRDFAAGKGRYDLLPFRTIHKLAQHFEKGAERYSARNWEKGIPLSVYLCSMQRHLMKLWLGYTDEPHDDALVWNAACLVETLERIRLGILPKELDDRPDIGQAIDSENDIKKFTANAK